MNTHNIHSIMKMKNIPDVLEVLMTEGKILL